LQENVQNAMRKIPQMDKLLSLQWINGFEAEIGRDSVKAVISDVLEEQRKKIKLNPDTAFDADSIANEIREQLKNKASSSLRRVVNATGVIIHTNLGRSILADEAVKAVCETAANYNTLEYSVEAGTRGNRNDHVEWLLCSLTGAEAAIVVNNNAGAVVLALAALAKDKEVVVSRGELVEIGGSFRIPDIMALSGTKMVEVGTTNRTHLYDYMKAITDDTAMLLKVHPSNYRIEGFTSAVSREELAEVSHGRNIIFMEDLGSGMLVDICPAGLKNDPTVRGCIEAGVDIVTFSGDKLLGGPQIGVIVGSSEIVDKMRKFPLLRALRVDKMTLAAFEATLRLYLKGKLDAIPTLAMLFEDEQSIRKRALRLGRMLRSVFKKAKLDKASADIVKVYDAVGGGAFPQSNIPGYAVAVKLPEFGNSGRLAEMMRKRPVPIITGASGNKVLLHVRTINREDETIIAAAFDEMLEPSKTGGIKH